jgi:predicted phage baseplate assembly protein
LTFDEIVRRARLRIPRYTPEWTDVNDSDPGMTLVQLFAWLTELLLHRMNQVPRRNYIKFLQLLNLEREPAQPALAHLTFEAEPGAADLTTIRAGAQISAQAPTGEELIFETDADLDLIRLPLTDLQVFDGAGFRVLTDANQPGGEAFRPLGWVPQPNSALYLGFTPDPAARQRLFPRQMRFRVFRPLKPEAIRPQLCRADAPRLQPPVKLVWEYRHPDDPATPARWRPLTTVDDESVAFTREGYILVEGPEQIAATIEGRVGDAPRYWLRCRLDQGSYPAGQNPEIDFIRPNGVPARNLATVRDELVGISDGRPDQPFQLRSTPVQPGSLVLSIEAPGQEAEEWQGRDDLLGSGARDQHYVLNANAGTIRFGNGIRGEIPVAGAEIIAKLYRYGGGQAGNVGAGEINAPAGNLSGVAAVTNPRPAVGGSNEQSVEDLMIEAPGRIRCRDRAVSTQDYEALAVEAGGVARAKALTGWHPDFPGVTTVPGALTLVIVPNSRDMPPNPSPDLLATVCGYLEPRRTLTAEVYLAAPTYIAISVEARVGARPYLSPEAVRGDVLNKLREFLDPLGEVDDPPAAQPGESVVSKPARRGWPFGQDLHPTRLYSVILSVDGVEAVNALTLRVNGIPHDNLTEAVRVPPDGLVYGTGHVIEVSSAVDL